MLLPRPHGTPLTPEGYAEWTAVPPPHAPGALGAFWAGVAPLTVAQYGAALLGRAPEQVSTRALQVLDARTVGRDAGEWDVYPLERCDGIWRRSHRAVLFTLDPRRAPRNLGDANPLEDLRDWVRPGDVLECRFLVAGLRDASRALTWGERNERVQRAIRRGVAAGYVRVVGTVEMAPRVIAPGRALCRRLGIPPRRAKESALGHGQLAIEAAMLLLRDELDLGRVTAILGDPDLASAARLAAHARRGGGRSSQPVQPIADAEVRLSHGPRCRVEMLTRSYGRDDVVAKTDALGRDGVHYVASSRTIASRVAGLIPDVRCYHF